jgi:hypothetical protein
MSVPRKNPESAENLFFSLPALKPSRSGKGFWIGIVIENTDRGKLMCPKTQNGMDSSFSVIVPLNLTFLI